MKKINKPSIILALTATAICCISLGVSKNASKEASAYFSPSETYPNHDAATYYNSIDSSKSGDALLADLRSLNKAKRKKTMGYKTGGNSAENSDFIYTDYDTSDPSTLHTDKNGQVYGTVISSFYSYKPCTGFNKEHVWPNTHGGNKVEADVHMARPTISEENSNRGHSYYVENMAHSTNGWDPYYAFHVSPGKTGDLGEQCINSRGESARIIFYCMVATDQLVLEAGHTNSAKTSNNKMGDLNDILKWHLQIDVTDREKNRNEGAEYLQGNRNPFIDHRSYACKIWGNTNSTTKSLCDEYNGWTDGDEPTPEKTLTSLSYTGTPDKTTYNVGDLFDPAGVTVKATFSDGTSEVVTSDVEWSELEKGDTSVSGTYTFEGVTKFVTINGLTVKEEGVATTGVEISESELELDIGDTSQLSCTVYPSDATNKNVSWKSSNTSVATVSSSGLVTALKAGEVTITVKTDNGGFTDTCQVVVNGEEPEPEKTLVGIEISNKPNKLVYNVGDAFDKEGIQVKALYKDGSDADVTSNIEIFKPSLTTAGVKSVTVSYESFEEEFEISILETTVEKIVLTKSPAKCEYFADEEFNPYGAVIKATMSDESVENNVTNLCSFEYDFEVSGAVKVKFGGKTTSLYVTLLEGEPSVEHNSANFAYSFNEKLDQTSVKDVSKKQWNSMEYYYNQLDDDAKAYVKNLKTSSESGEVSAEVPNEEALKQCAKKYDETYLAHKAEGFRDFIGRNPQPAAPEKGPNYLLILVGVCGGVFVLTILIVIIAVSVSKKGKKENA